MRIALTVSGGMGGLAPAKVAPTPRQVPEELASRIRKALQAGALKSPIVPGAIDQMNYELVIDDRGECVVARLDDNAPPNVLDLLDEIRVAIQDGTAGSS